MYLSTTIEPNPFLSWSYLYKLYKPECLAPFFYIPANVDFCFSPQIWLRFSGSLKTLISQRQLWTLTSVFPINEKSRAPLSVLNPNVSSDVSLSPPSHKYDFCIKKRDSAVRFEVGIMGNVRFPSWVSERGALSPGLLGLLSICNEL